MPEALLQTVALRKEFGGLTAVDDVDFTVPPGAIVSLIGPNGAGKTTFFNMLTGVYRPTAGRVVFLDEDMTGKPPHAFTQRGIGRTFQNIRLFQNMTALENVLVGMHVRLKGNLFEAILRTPRVKREEKEARERARELLEFSGLRRKDREIGKNLSYGDQRRLEVARALATQPKLLLLDEPTAGMNPQETADFTAFVARLREEQELAVLLIEHDMRVVMGVSDRVTVLDYGEKIAEGTPQEIQKNERVIEAYLGSGGGDVVSAAGAPLLEVEGIETFYGSIQALKGISLTVNEGEIVTLIGANGAGKSTTLRSINGLNHPRKGKIAFRGKDITHEQPHQVVKLGIAQSPEGPQALPADVGDREPRDGRVPAQGQGCVPRGHGPHLRALPEARRAAEPEGGHDVGRRAADVRDRARAHGAADAPDARRAVDGPRADLRRAHLRDDRRGEQAGHLDPARRAERADGARRRDRGYVLETGHVALADDAKALAQNPEVRKTYLGET